MASGGGGSGLPILAAFSTVGAALGGAMLQSQAADAGRDQVKVQMDAEKAQAAQRAAEVRRQLAATLGAQQAILASRGISDYGAGSTPAAMGADSIYAAGRDLSTNKFNLGQVLGKLGFMKQQYAFQKQAAWINAAGQISGTAVQMAGMSAGAGGPGNVPTSGSSPVLSYTTPSLSYGGPR